MVFNSFNIPKELLKFRLDKQLGRLKQILSDSNSANVEEEEEEEDKFQLYQRILSWFIMGRLAKSEYDGILSELLTSTELIELHNKVIELLRAIYCDSGCPFTDESNGLSNFKKSFLNSFSFELNLLPEEELKDFENTSDSKMITKSDVCDIASAYDDSLPKQQINLDEDENLLSESNENSTNILCSILSTKIKPFRTLIEDLTPSEEALISEALRNPIHDIASMEREPMIPMGFDIFTERFCTEISSLPDQNIMKQRFLRIGTMFSSVPNVSDAISVLACKSLEDYMKNLLENVSTMKFGREPLLRPPISYIFPEESISIEDNLEGSIKSTTTETLVTAVTESDLNLLFKLKPWLLADMEADLKNNQSV